MKNFLILFLICCGVQSIFSQSQNTEKSTPDDDNMVYNTAGIDVKPDFPGGSQKFHEFVADNFKAPETKINLKGKKIYVTFVVEKDGSLSDIKVLRDVGFGTGAEAIRVLKISPKWNSGEHNGKKIRVLYSMPMIVN